MQNIIPTSLFSSLTEGSVLQALLIALLVGFALLGLAFGQSSGTINSSFAPTYRYTGAAITSDLAWLIGAGFAPFVALILATHLGLWSIGLYLLSGAAGTLIALWVNRTLATDRQEPAAAE